MVRFSLPALMLTGISVCLALGGCTAGTSDEYRTFEEVQAENETGHPQLTPDVEPVNDETAIADETRISQDDAGSSVVANDAGQAESIGRAAIDEAPSADAGAESSLAKAALQEGDGANPLASSGPSQQPAQLRTAGDAADVPAEPATGASVSTGNPPSNGSSEADLVRGSANASGLAEANADAASGNVALRPDQGASADLSPAALSTAVREIKLLVPEKSFNTEGPEGALRVSYDDLNLLTILNMEPVPPNPEPYFPDWLRALEGRRIRIRGFMYPAFVETGLRGFILVRDNQECCFGPGAKIYDHIEVAMRNGVTTDYIPGRPFDVVGRLHIRPEAEDEELYQLYQIEDAIVIDQ